jgi:hypothetical protein
MYVDANAFISCSLQPPSIAFRPNCAIFSLMLATDGKLERVIKDRTTGNYYVSRDRWTSKPRQAKVFEDLSLAFQAAHNGHLQHCSVIVFRVPSGQVDAQFPID